jgi:hydroxylamine reductase (hybrid-cluster protein)
MFIYYFVHKLDTLLKVVIHFNIHTHLVENNICGEILEEIKGFVDKEVFHTPSGKNFSFDLFMSKSLSQHLFNEDGDDLVELIEGEQLYQVMDKSLSNIYY